MSRSRLARSALVAILDGRQANVGIKDGRVALPGAHTIVTSDFEKKRIPRLPKY